MNIFSYLDYRKALSDRQKELKKTRPTTTLEAMSLHCRVQKPYLSKVFNHSGNLNSDQLYLACEFLKLNPNEQKYIEILHQIDMCTVPKRKDQLLSLAHDIQKQELNSDQHIRVNLVPKVHLNMAQYYANPQLQLVHMFLTVERFRLNPKVIAQNLSISEMALDELIDELESLQIVSRNGGLLKVLQDNLHLPSNSKLLRTYRNMSKLQAIAKIDSLDASNTYNFNVVFSCDEAARGKIQKRFLEFLNEAQKISQSAKEEDVFQMSFDLFKWS